MNRDIYYIKVNGTPTSPEDHDVSGTWIVSIDADAEIKHGQIASAVLDEFHGNVAITRPDDFEIMVLNADGYRLYENDDDEQPSMQHLIEFEGPVDPDDLPLEVAAFDPWK